MDGNTWTYVYHYSFSGNNCCRLNVCVPPKIICWILTPKCDCIWRWAFMELIKVTWDHQGWASIPGKESLLSDSLRPSLPSSPSLWGHGEKVPSSNKERGFRRNQNLDLVFLFPELCENKSLFFIAPQPMVSCYSSLSRRRQKSSCICEYTEYTHCPGIMEQTKALWHLEKVH